jgi:DNA-directed RNA polymerase subunit RPC12/RpoP
MNHTGLAAWRLFDCPHCEKPNAALLASGIAAAQEVKDTLLVLHPQCIECGKEARIRFTDWDDHEGVVGVPDWACPHCRSTNTLPTVGRIISVDASFADVVVV